ncbi:MAG: restriction endonuclease subunit R, partial [Nanoarchaeota archaeon]|nr:restriction endonuclease subunit R [Nanoarchaeota archaeon]
KKLWDYINTKSTYKVNFDSEKLIKDSILKINKELNVIQIIAEIKEGMTKDNLEQNDISNKKLFSNEEFTTENLENVIDDNIKYDLIGKLVTDTNLTRNTIIKILSGINEDKFNEFKRNPEDFMMKVADKINEVKAEIIYENLEYEKTSEKIPISIFEDDLGSSDLYPELMKKYIYDYLESDSKTEIEFGKSIDSFDKVMVFSKMPRKKYDIKTPVGSFSPDWLIVFDKDKVQYAYFVVETKGSNSKMQLRK